MALTLSVIVPVRNEADNILPLIGEIQEALDGVHDFEIIYVNDGSDDATPERLADAASRFSALRILHHEKSCGQSAAIWTGARAARGTWIVTLDGDGQNDPADIPALVAIALGGGGGDGEASPLHLVTGIRKRREDNWLRRISSRIANGVRRMLLRDGVSDTGCGLKVMEREAFLRLPFFDHMHRYYPALVKRGGGRIACVNVNHRPRLRGVSNYGLFDRLWVGITDLFGVAWLARRIKHPIIKSDQ